MCIRDRSILVSGVSFFASTFGVGLYSNIDIISSMCSLIARGALCSVAVVLFLLPAMLLLCDGFIVHTTSVSYTHLVFTSPSLLHSAASC